MRVEIMLGSQPKRRRSQVQRSGKVEPWKAQFIDQIIAGKQPTPQPSPPQPKRKGKR